MARRDSSASSMHQFTVREMQAPRRMSPTGAGGPASRFLREEDVMMYMPLAPVATSPPPQRPRAPNGERTSPWFKLPIFSQQVR